MISEKSDHHDDPWNNGDFCTVLEDFGKFYRDKKDPWIQRIEFYGRFNYQWSHSDIDLNGLDVHGAGGDLRRLRFGTKVEFLDDWKIEGGVRLSRGRKYDNKMGYSALDDFHLTYKAGDFLGFEDWRFTYGRQKFAVTGEWNESSTEIPTIERSNLSNFFGRSRATGFKARASRGDIDYTMGIMAPEGSDTFGQWGGGVVYYANANIDLGKNKRLWLDFLYSDADPSVANQVYDYDWAASATYRFRLGDWRMMVNGIYGQTNDEDVYGVVITPTYELIEDRLEFVARYQWAAASDDVFTINRRNIVDTVRHELGSFPRIQRIGDENQTIYAGLNYYFCGDNAKAMVGVEHETLKGSTANIEATTVWAAFRMFF